MTQIRKSPADGSRIGCNSPGSGRILHLRFDLPPDHDVELLERLRRLLQNFTPRVEMIEPDGAVLDLTGAIRFWNRDTRGITELVQLRTLAYFGLRS
jgi:DNA polymerase-4